MKILNSQRDGNQHFKALELLSLKAYGDVRLARVCLVRLKQMMAESGKWSELELESIVKLICDLYVLFPETMDSPGLDLLLGLLSFPAIKCTILEGLCKLAYVRQADSSVIRPLVEAIMQAAIPPRAKQMLKVFFSR